MIEVVNRKNYREVMNAYKKGSLVTILFDTRRCIFRIKNYEYNEVGALVVRAYDGLNADNEFLEDHTFGLNGNAIRHANKAERDLLHAKEKENHVVIDAVPFTFILESLPSLSKGQLKTLLNEVAELI